VPALERRLVLHGGARHAVAARRHHVLRRELAEVLRQQPRARRAEGLGRTTKQLGCVRNDGVVDLDLAHLVRARLPRVLRPTKSGHARRAPRRRLGGRARVRRAARRLYGPHPRPDDAVVPRRVLAPLEQLASPSVSAAVTLAAPDAMWIGRLSHRCSAIISLTLSLSLSYFLLLRRVAPHCVNTLMILHAAHTPIMSAGSLLVNTHALSLSLSLSLSLYRRRALTQRLQADTNMEMPGTTRAIGG